MSEIQIELYCYWTAKRKQFLMCFNVFKPKLLQYRFFFSSYCRDQRRYVVIILQYIMNSINILAGQSKYQPFHKWYITRILKLNMQNLITDNWQFFLYILAVRTCYSHLSSSPICIVSIKSTLISLPSSYSES